MVTRAGEVGNGKLLFNFVSVWEDEKLLEVDSGDGYTTKRMY